MKVVVGAGDLDVERDIAGVAGAVLLVAGHCLCHSLLGAVERGEQLRAHIDAGELAGVALKFGADVVHVDQLVAPGDTDGGALVRHQHDEMHRLELAQRLPHRRAADPEALADLVLKQMSSRGMLACEYRGLEAERDLIRKAGD